MRSDEFAKIATAIRGMYPGAGILDTDIQFSIWAKVAESVPAEIGEQFVIDWATTSKFPPTLADFNRYAVEKLTPGYKDAGQAWEDAIKACERFGYDKEREALESLDELTASALRSMGYRSICMSDRGDHDVLRAQFRNIYEGRLKIKEKERMTYGLQNYAALMASERERIEGGEV